MYLEQDIKNLEEIDQLVGPPSKEMLDVLDSDLQPIQRTILDTTATSSDIYKKNASVLSQRIFKLSARYDRDNATKDLSSTPSNIDKSPAINHQSRLPKLELPTFDGDLMKWQNILGMFHILWKKTLH